MFSAIRKTFKSRPGLPELQSNFWAGLTVGVIALPLSMALAIASGAPPQNGLYTAIIAGILIAITGGSKVNISGPTAAFVVILLPIVQKYGLGGLLISGFLAGVILVLMGLARLGNLIQIVPYSVTVGFTAGIGVVIATLQIKDFLGLNFSLHGGHFTDIVLSIFKALPQFTLPEAIVGIATLSIMIVWNKLKMRIPSHLVAVFAGSVIAWLAGVFINDFEVATIGSRFHYEMNGVAGNGIPPSLPSLVWPWELPGKDGLPIHISFDLIRQLMFPAFAIAILGALESLLCAVIADGITGKKHDPNDELIGQGIGNIVAPLFGGIPATAALARTAANVRAGGTLPIASIVHGVFIILSILILAPLLAYIPMASLAAMLLMVAWNMSESKHFIRIARFAPRNDVIVLLTCFFLTVLFDMEIAIAVGMMLASMLFIHRSIKLTDTKLVEKKEEHREVPESILIYDINGAMFFGSAQKALSILTNIRKEIEVVILDMADVNMLDMTAMVTLESIIQKCEKSHVTLIVTNLDMKLRRNLRKIGVRRKKGVFEYAGTINEAVSMALRQQSHKGMGHGHGPELPPMPAQS